MKEKQPITDRMYRLQLLIQQVVADMNHLLKEYPEEEARPYIELLGKINEQYCASLDQLTERLQAQRGWDFEV